MEQRVKKFRKEVIIAHKIKKLLGNKFELRAWVDMGNGLSQCQKLPIALCEKNDGGGRELDILDAYYPPKRNYK
jgi:hypothetical protein